jgi:hypothetical protein
MSGTPLLRSVTPDNCSNSWAIGTPKSSIENLDPQVWVCSTERLFWHAGDKEKELLDLNAVLEANPDSLEFLRLRARGLYAVGAMLSTSQSATFDQNILIFVPFVSGRK